MKLDGRLVIEAIEEVVPPLLNHLVEIGNRLKVAGETLNVLRQPPPYRMPVLVHRRL